jgi:hypothetical protein
MNQKPRVRFCWLCARRLQANHFAEVEHDGHLRIFHKACAKKVEKMREHEIGALFKVMPIIF